MCDRNFGWTIEMQIKAVQQGLRIQEIPVRYRHRIGQSKISGTLSGSIKAGCKILYTIGKYYIASFSAISRLEKLRGATHKIRLFPLVRDITKVNELDNKP